MADPVAAVVAAPKKAFAFAEHQLFAFLFLAAVLLLAFVYYETRNPGKLKTKVMSVPGVGPWVTNTKKAA